MELKRYAFPIVLDDDGHEQHQRTATDADDLAVPGEETSPSEHIWQLVEAEQDKFPQLDQRSAVERVRKKNPQLFTLYASEINGMLRVC